MSRCELIFNLICLYFNARWGWHCTVRKRLWRWREGMGGEAEEEWVERMKTKKMLVGGEKVEGEKGAGKELQRVMGGGWDGMKYRTLKYTKSLCIHKYHWHWILKRKLISSSGCFRYPRIVLFKIVKLNCYFSKMYGFMYMYFIISAYTCVSMWL